MPKPMLSYIRNYYSILYKEQIPLINLKKKPFLTLQLIFLLKINRLQHIADLQKTPNTFLILKKQILKTPSSYFVKKK